MRRTGRSIAGGVAAVGGPRRRAESRRQPGRLVFGAAAIFALIFFCSAQVHGQAPAGNGNGAEPAVLRRPITLQLERVPLGEALERVAAQAGLRLSYATGAVPVDRRVTLRLDAVPVEEALRRLLEGTALEPRLAAPGQVVLVPAPARPTGQATGRIVGRVRSAQTGEALASVSISVDSGALRVLSAVDGRFALGPLPAGSYEVRAELIGYAPRVVTGVPVRGGETTELDLVLTTAAIQLEELVVDASAARGTVRAALLERQQAATVVDIVAREQISRSTDGDAAAVVRRMPGAEVKDGQFVFIRGMGDRYASVTLNGTPIPSITPDRKAVPLDIVPAELLETVRTEKGFTPDMPADYTGGLIRLETRSVPASRVFTLKTGLSYNTATSLQERLLYPGCPGDWTSFGDCYELPAELGVQPDGKARRLGSFTPEARSRVVAGLLDMVPWGANRQTIPLNQSHALTYGDEVHLLGRPVGLLFSGTYSASYAALADYAYRSTELAQDGGGAPRFEIDFPLGGQTTREIGLAGLLQASVALGRAHRVGLSGLLNRTATDETLALEGFEEQNSQYTNLLQIRNERVETTLWQAQLEGEHLLPLDLELDWRAAYSRTGRYEPNTHRVLYRSSAGEAEPGQGFRGRGGFLENGPYAFWAEGGSGSPLHQDLHDEARWLAANLTLPLRARGLPAALKVGGALDRRDRTVYYRELVFTGGGGDAYEPPDSLFSPGRAARMSLVEIVQGKGNYKAEHDVLAAYAMVDAEVLPRFRLVGGVRLERGREEMHSYDPFEDLALIDVGCCAELDDTDWLPAVNLTYALSDGMNVRAGYGRTLARPNFRELSPWFFLEHYGGYYSFGNPALVVTRIDNYDLRWEWFPRPGAVLSAGVFYKAFDHPIEPIVDAALRRQTWINSRSATTYGAEIELRTDFGFLSPALEALGLNANLTLLDTQVDSTIVRHPQFSTQILRIPPQGRTIFGQTPYLWNVTLAYDAVSTGTAVTALLTGAGRRLQFAAVDSDYPPIYEQARAELDLLVQQRVWGGLSLKASISRLLGSRVRYGQEFPNGETVYTTEYDRGKTFSLSVTWEPGRARPAL